MFSTTFPSGIQDAAGEFLNDYVFIVIGRLLGGACVDVIQEFIQVERNEKRNRLLEILEDLSSDDKVLVFCESSKGADFLATILSVKKINTTSIHGDRTQDQREEALREFTNGRRQVLVTTSIAARDLGKVF